MVCATRQALGIVLASSAMLFVAASALSPMRRARADAPAGRYVVSSATVMDTKTQLTWQRGPTTLEGGTIATLQDAQQACLAPWRLPELKELATLVDESASAPPFIDATAFPGTTTVPYWSNTLSNTSPDDFRVFVLRADGTSTTVYLNGTQFSGAYVRCVQP